MNLLLAIRSAKNISDNSLSIGFIMTYMKVSSNGVDLPAAEYINIEGLGLSITKRNEKGFEFPLEYRNKNRTDPNLRFQYLIYCPEIQRAQLNGKLTSLVVFIGSLNNTSLFDICGDIEIELHSGVNTEKIPIDSHLGKNTSVYFFIAKQESNSQLIFDVNRKPFIDKEWRGSTDAFLRNFNQRLYSDPSEPIEIEIDKDSSPDYKGTVTYPNLNIKKNRYQWPNWSVAIMVAVLSVVIVYLYMPINKQLNSLNKKQHDILSEKKVIDWVGVDQQQSVDRKLPVLAPSVHIGEYWKVKRSGFGFNTVDKVQILSVTKQGVHVGYYNAKSIKQRDVLLNANWEIVNDIGKVTKSYSPALPYFDFPLFVGKKWTREISVLKEIDTSSTVDNEKVTVNGEVIGWENVDVNGVKVDVLKLEVALLFSPSKKKVLESIMYSPIYKTSVLTMTTVQENGNSNITVSRLLSCSVCVQ